METADNLSLRVASFAYYLDTAKENLVHRISAQDQTPLPLTSARTNTPNAIKPPFSIKFSNPKDNNQDHANLRVDSFSYNLNTAGDNNFVFEIPGPVQDPTSAFSFSQEIPKDREIGVFNADKYFNMKLEYQTDKVKNGCKNHKEPASIIKQKGTPSLSSEASSWNSQSTLLPLQRNHDSLMKHKKSTSGRRIFTGFGCRGPCFDKKSVHINENVAQGAYYTSKRIDHHLPLILPTISSSLGGHEDHHLAVKKQLMKVGDLEESRLSIEVFGSKNSSLKGSDVATNMERKLSVLTWDAIPKGRTVPTSSTIGSTTTCDDMASDASSDLFEIENISGSIYPLTSEPADDMSTCMSPTSLYAPSEASIQWSVVTASAADYSHYNDDTSVSVAGDVISRKVMSNKSSKIEAKKGGLLGCKSHKAVDVAENVCLKSSINVQKAKNQARI